MKTDFNTAKIMSIGLFVLFKFLKQLSRQIRNVNLLCYPEGAMTKLFLEIISLG